MVITIVLTFNVMDSIMRVINGWFYKTYKQTRYVSNHVIYCIISNNDSLVSRLRWIMQSPKLKEKEKREKYYQHQWWEIEKTKKKTEDRRKYGNLMFQLYNTGIPTIIKTTIKKQNHVLIYNSNLSPFIEYYTHVVKLDRIHCCFRSRA